MPREDALFGFPLKYLSLVLLTAQVSAVLANRYATQLWLRTLGFSTHSTSFSSGHTLPLPRTAAMWC